MKRFYVLPVTVVHENIPGTSLPMHNLFHPRGCTWLDLSDGMILLCSDDFATEWHEDAWHAHPEVARLQHPTAEPKVTIGDLLKDDYADKQFKQKHVDALAAIGVTKSDTVWDVHRKAKAIHPAIHLSKPY